MNEFDPFEDSVEEFIILGVVLVLFLIFAFWSMP